MRPFEVKRAFPEDHVYEDWMGGNLNDSLLYHGIIVGFDRCDAYGPLEDARVDHLIVIHRREDAMLCGKPLLGWTKDLITSELVLRGYPVEEDFDREIYVPEKLRLTFDDDNRLEFVEM